MVEEHKGKRFSIKWSYSRREVLEQCPRRYYYQYYGANLRAAVAEPLKDTLRFLKTLGNRHLRAGEILHLVVKSYLKHLQDGESWSLARMLCWARDIYHRDLEYSRQYQSREQSDDGEYPPALLLEFYYGFEDAEELWTESESRLVKALTNFMTNAELEHFRFGARHASAIVEKSVHLEEEHFSMDGKIDLAYPQGGRIVVVDWKMGQSNGSSDGLQLLSYALGAVKEFGCPSSNIDLYRVHLANGKVSPFAVYEREVRSAKARIIQDLERMQELDDYGQKAVSEAFTPCNQPRVCALCSFRGVCVRE
jgi:CRISPR/Cas system-associated exonuclease Cas4 (RecB family)